MTSVTVAYGSRFGSTAKLAEKIAVGLRSVGATTQLIDVGEKTLIVPQPLVILSAIIWDRPVPVMREWIRANMSLHYRMWCRLRFSRCTGRGRLDLCQAIGETHRQTGRVPVRAKRRSPPSQQTPPLGMVGSPSFRSDYAQTSTVRNSRRRGESHRSGTENRTIENNCRLRNEQA